MAIKVCIDAGHNSTGADTGASGNGLREQDLTLDIARRLFSVLNAVGFEVIMTRDGDFVNGAHSTVAESLKTRCDIANAFGADLFVSIHINAGGGTGTEVYALPGGQAVVCAQRVLSRLVYQAGWANRGVKTDRELYVLVHTDMPAILTENGFIDTGDAQKLADASFRQGIAEAHAKGICDFFGINYIVPAPQPTPQPVPQPEPQVIIKEVPVEKIVEKRVEVPVEVIKEVPVEKIVEKPVEVIKEVPVPINESSFKNLDPKYLPLALIAPLKMLTDSFGLPVPDVIWNDVLNVFSFLVTVAGVYASWRKK